jgi:tRNA 5-methylaminomethyl-2-thiouridine biosynthesis bifunctional protein
MPAPQPLGPTPAPALDWSRPGTPAATDFGDIYFSTDGGLAETRAVFLDGCGLPDRWQERDVFTIAELGFGSGLNFLATWQAWLATAKAGQRLHFVSIEKFPFDREQLGRALTAWPELSTLSERLIAAWPGRVRGMHRLDFGNVSLTLIHTDVTDALDAVAGLRADAWYLDGFSPGKNPGMWTDKVLGRIGMLCAPEARAATFSVAGAVRQALSAAGFTVTKQPGFGRKRHRLEAVFPGESVPTASKGKSLIIGAGIAGRALAEALSRRGADFDIIDSGQPAASGNPAALIKPRLDLQDRPESRFFLSAFLHARRTYLAQPDCILSEGVTQKPKTPAQATRFEKIAVQGALGDTHVRWDGMALQMDSALVVDPAKIWPNFEVQQETAEDALKRDYTRVFYAAGYGIRTLLPELALRFSRGQLSWANATGLERPLAYGGYALPLDGATLIGATHDRLDDRDPFEIRTEDDAKNFADFESMTDQSLTPADRSSRASVRVTSADTLPVLISENRRHILTGLGSRGFVFAPLLAEALVAESFGEVLPITQAVRIRFQPR